MRLTVTHRGVPLGHVQLTAGETAVGELDVLDGYAAVRDTIRSASVALWNHGFFSAPGTETPVDMAALHRVQAMPLELRDDGGSLVAADFVNVIERPDSSAAPVVLARFRHTAAGVPAEVPPVRRDPGQGARPEQPDR